MYRQIRLLEVSPFTVWGQNYWLNGQPLNVTGSLEEVEDISMSGSIVFNDNSRIYEDVSRRLRLSGYNGIQADSNLLLGSGFAIKTVDVGQNGADLLAYKTVSSGTVNGVTTNHWFVGTGNLGVLRSGGALKRFDGTASYNIWDESNFTPGNYLPLTGGTLTGDLAINGAGISINAQN